MNPIPRVFSLCPLWLVACLALCVSPCLAEEEFCGPFPSWRDLKRDYGARGDGRADDSAPLQQALDELTKHTNFCVLYLPSGAYRLAKTVRTVRKAHTDCLGVAIVGEDPANTTLVWDGEPGQTMFEFDAWYSKISRIAFDGRGRAGVALRYGPAFSTYNETSDLILRDAGTGILFGADKSAGQAENAVLRCQFLRCTNAGIVTANFNSMDIWVWYSRFEDCGHALYNVCGNFHAFENTFLRSKIADIGSKNLMVFSFVNNFSRDSYRFLDFDNGHSWGSPTTISGNRIVHPRANFPIKLGNGGPYLVMDNQVFLPAGSTNQCVKLTWGDQTLAGNTYNTTNAVRLAGRHRLVAEKFDPDSAPPSDPPTLPATPPRRNRPVIELPPGSGADRIQQAITEATKLNGQRPIVHLPMGVYKIDRPIAIPSGADLQLVGDGAGETATVLRWSGKPGEAMLAIEGPTRVVLRDLHLHAGNSRGVTLTQMDAAGGRVFADQLNVNGPQKPEGPVAALLIDGLQQTDVLMRCLQGSGHGGAWVEVAGRGGNTETLANTKGQASIFCGATGSADAQYRVRDGGRLVVRSVYHEKSANSLRGLHLAGAGILAIDATRFSYRTSPSAPLISADDFSGMFTLATSLLMPVDSTNTCRFELRGDGRSASILALNNLFWINETGVTADVVWRNGAQPPYAGGLIHCNLNSGLKGATPNGYAALENRGYVSATRLLCNLQPLRAARIWHPGIPSEAPVDLQIHRVMVSSTTGTAVEIRP